MDKICVVGPCWEITVDGCKPKIFMFKGYKTITMTEQPTDINVKVYNIKNFIRNTKEIKK
jgi:hypothetical protein